MVHPCSYWLGLSTYSYFFYSFARFPAPWTAGLPASDSCTGTRIEPKPQKHWQVYSLLLSTTLAGKLGLGCGLAGGFSCCRRHRRRPVGCHHHDQLPAHEQHQQHQHWAVRAANGRVKDLDLDCRWWEVIGIIKPSCQNQVIYQRDKPKSWSGLSSSWAARTVIGTLPMSSYWNVEDVTANISSNPAKFRDLIREIK